MGHPLARTVTGKLQMNRSKFKVALVAAAALAALGGPAHALGIVDVSLDNRSAPDVALNDNGERFREFRSDGAARAPTLVGDVATLESRMQWMTAQRVLPGGSGADLLFNRQVEYDLHFTVDDPTSRGYTLDIDTLLRGALTAEWAGVLAGADFPKPGVVASGTPMLASLDSGSGFSVVADLNTPLRFGGADDVTPFRNELVEERGSFDAGTFHGTRDFTLRFSTLLPNTGANLLPFNLGEADVRFGLEPTLAQLNNAFYPGVDGQPAGDHGHFVRITAQYLQPVPEPETYALWIAGLVALGFHLRRRRAEGAAS